MKLTKRLRLLSVSAAILLVSCAATPPVIKCIGVDLPAVPRMPVLTEEQDASIPQEAYEVLVERDQVQASHIKRVYKVIEAHNAGCK